jgi:tetratricopeptide (TPR) repeat protein
MAASDTEEFIEQLISLRRWAGQPSLRVLRRWAGTRRTERGDEVDALPASTTSDLLNGSSLPGLPRLAFVEAFVTACARAADLPADQVDEFTHRWRQAWRSLGTGAAGPTRQATVTRTPAENGWTQSIGAALMPMRPAIRAELPADIATFTGRKRAAEYLSASLTSGEQPGLTPIHVVRGPAGIGKTALAVHVAHQVAADFPDGQLYVDLRGTNEDQPPRRTVDVLARWLRSLTGTDKAPADPEEAIGLFRSLVAGRRILFLLDNAFSGGQVRPLVPASPGCAVLVTSRSMLATLDGAAHLDLGVLTESESIELLGKVVGQSRVAAEQAAATRITALCGHLPQRIRVAGGHLVARPGEPLANLVTQLADPGPRGHPPRYYGNLSVRPGVTGNYRELGTDDAPAARIFRMLGLLDVGELDLPTIAAIADAAPAETAPALDRLADAGLLRPIGANRYRMDDATKQYARASRSGGRDGAEYRSALGNLLDRYVAGAEQASVVLRPTDLRRITRSSAQRIEPGSVALRTPADAIAWVDAEMATMVSMIEQTPAIRGPLPALAGRLALALYQPLSNRGRIEERIQVGKIAVDAARAAGDSLREAQAIEDLSYICATNGLVSEAGEHAYQALHLWRQCNHRHGEMMAMLKLGFVFRLQRKFDLALTCLEKGLLIGREINSGSGQGFALNNLGLVYQHIGGVGRAIQCHLRSIGVHQEMGDEHGEAIAKADLGWAYQRRGDLDQAAAYHRSSLAVFRAVADRYNEAEQLWGLGNVFHEQGNHNRALSCCRESLSILDDIDCVGPEGAEHFNERPTEYVPQIIRINT